MSNKDTIAGCEQVAQATVDLLELDTPRTL